MGVASAFTATIMRVFRRAWSLRGVTCDGMTGSVLQEVLGQAKLAGVQRSWESNWRFGVARKGCILRTEKFAGGGEAEGHTSKFTSE